MKKLLIVICCTMCLMGCSHKQQPLEPTQIVNGKSIVMPPDFYVLPKAQKTNVPQSDEKE